MPDELCFLTAEQLAAEIRARRLSPVEAVDAALAQADRLNGQLNAIVTRCDERARDAARAAETAVMRGEDLPPLLGVPITVKDLHLTAGIRTTLGSKLFEDFVPHNDQPIVERLKRAGAIIIGKTNTSEFGLIPLAANALFGESNNPWDLTYNTGGSSGGAAAAVACGMGPLATASDGGGSIRIPASFCGVFGLKPQMGRVPHVPFPRGWESLSHQGVLSRTVRDTALALDVLAGAHRLDRWSLPTTGRSFLEACTGDARGLRLAWCPRLGNLPVEHQVMAVCQQAAEHFEALGCHVTPLELDLPDLGPAQQTIVLCEAAVGMQARRAEWEQTIFPPTRKMLPNADKLTYYDLVKANWAREEYWERFSPVFDQFDAVLTPTAPITATLNGTLGPRVIEEQTVRALSWLGHVVPANMTWQPAASLPVGFDGQNLPVGLQIIGRQHDEWTVLRLASAYEAAHPWTDKRPPIVAQKGSS
ncbi:MAG TPA: amidase [Pirellulales bacterium]|nr:amidase [Pirellulales bacterium]